MTIAEVDSRQTRQLPASFPDDFMMRENVALSRLSQNSNPNEWAAGLWIDSLSGILDALSSS